MPQETVAIRSPSSIEGAFHIGQGLGFVAGGVLAVASVWQSTFVGGVSTASLGVAAFALGFVSNGAAAYTAGRIRRAVLSFAAAGGFVVFTIEASEYGLAGATALFLIGLLLMADSIDSDGLWDRISG